jgi:hypothetical protein
LGHHASGQGHSRRRTTRLEREAEAWGWAFDTALEDPSPEVRDWIFGPEAFRSYVDNEGWNTAGPAALRLASKFELGYAA